MHPLFLGLDCSTQSFSGVVIDYGTKKIIYEKQLIFKEPFHRVGNVVYSHPLVWVEALDQFFQQMQQEGVPLGNILAVSGSAQQHGSVYLKENLDFSRPYAPIWMDSSTTQECEEIRKAMGGKLATIEATGSDTFERFTGPQVRKFYRTEPESYAQTKSIALVSSFLSSLMAGKISPIDYGDGSGMNLMDIRKKAWHPKALEATAPKLITKLPSLVPSTTVVGKISPYFQKYGLNPEALSLVWTGDNPSSLIGLGLIEPGMTGVSLGTSFTHFGTLKEPHVDPKGEGHLFISPTGDYMTLNCFLNGALAVKKMRELYNLDWETFNHHLENTVPGNGGAILLPYFDPEIVPKVTKPGLHRFDLKESDVAANCRALIEAQMMSMRLHSDWMHLKSKRIYATGGVSNNKAILQILADVFDCTVLKIEVSKSTALGAALRAAYAYFGNKSWKEIVEGFSHPILAAKPKTASIYHQLVQKYAEHEKNHSKSKGHIAPSSDKLS